MDPLDCEYKMLLQLLKDVELPNDPGKLDCCIWWLYQLNNMTGEKRSRNFMLKKMTNDLQNGRLSKMFWIKQKINFDCKQTKKVENLNNQRCYGDYDSEAFTKRLEKQNMVIEQQNVFIRVWLPGYLNLISELLNSSANKEEIINAMEQYDVKDFEEFRKTKPLIKNLINEIWLKSFDLGFLEANKTDKAIKESKQIALKSEQPEKFSRKYQLLKYQLKKLNKSVICLQKKNKTMEEHYEGKLDSIKDKEQQHSMLEDMAEALENRYKTIFNKEI